MDEFDALMLSRSRALAWQASVINQMLVKIDGNLKLNNLIIVGIKNHKEKILGVFESVGVYRLIFFLKREPQNLQFPLRNFSTLLKGLPFFVRLLEFQGSLEGRCEKQLTLEGYESH